MRPGDCSIWAKKVQKNFGYFPVDKPKKGRTAVNVIKLSKSAYKKCPPRKVEVGIFLCFRYVDCLCLLHGQDNDLSLVNGVGVHKTVGVALEDGLVLHQSGICQPNCFLISAFTLSKSLQVKIGISRLISSTLLSHHLNLSSNSISSSSKRF